MQKRSLLRKYVTNKKPVLLLLLMGLVLFTCMSRDGYVGYDLRTHAPKGATPGTSFDGADISGWSSRVKASLTAKLGAEHVNSADPDKGIAMGVRLLNIEARPFWMAVPYKQGLFASEINDHLFEKGCLFNCYYNEHRVARLVLDQLCESPGFGGKPPLMIDVGSNTGGVV